MKKILVCNQKMFLTKDEAINLKYDMLNLDFDNIDLIVCPNYLNMELFSDFKLGAQDVHYEDRGPFTSSISSYDLSMRGVEYSLVGHSYLRDSQTDEEINLKIKALYRNSMTPILCIGETKYERELNKTIVTLKKQLLTGLSNIELELGQELIVAYEPRWIINSNLQMSKNDIVDVFKYIKKILEELGIYNYTVLYGGNINKDNIKLIDSSIIDGYLLGHSSVEIEELKDILNFTQNM